MSIKLRNNPIYDSLPSPFSRQQFREAQIARGMKGTNYRQDIKRLKDNGWILEIECGLYEKLKA